ncbi:uncharacterized protein LOC118190208 [Stegodyphus dumicola]|uniref:uncharacterized protein LOC118190208 n=1 Tax=Stegodyphus dumicola TaxID=202533 RepID=UPI0015B1868F|nr:uncharacterized protein LOC118190208 [Stegodyphus dumicola]
MLIEKIVSSLYIFYLFNTSFTHADSMQRKEKEIFSRRSPLALQGKQSFLKSEIWRRLLNNPDSANISRRDSHYSERFDSFNKKVYKRSKKKNKTLLKVQTKIRKRPFIAHRNASKILKAAANKKKHIVGREKKISTSTMTQDGEETTSMITEEIFSSTVHGEITSETTQQNQDDADISDSKSDKESMFLEDRSFEDGDEKDDIFIESGSSCDRENQQTCWFERQVGDILTLETNIIGSNGPNSSFIIRWSKLYHKRNRKRPLSIEITHDFVGDGFVCSKASGSNHYRHKRIRRDSGGISNDFGIQSGLFYASAAPISAVYHSRGRNEYVSAFPGIWY